MFRTKSIRSGVQLIWDNIYAQFPPETHGHALPWMQAKATTGLLTEGNLPSKLPRSSYLPYVRNLPRNLSRSVAVHARLPRPPFACIGRDPETH
eukprot:scaffold23095_cov129-Isochrysis_galbana.AAC.1